jgi:transcriptional regulator with XRE-family HTH domain
MKNFGETLRELRVAQNIGLREMAVAVDISPAYLSRIERGKERPPRPELIKNFARLLAADPDALFRLSSSTDPEVVDFLRNQPEAMNLIRFIKRKDFSSEEFESLLKAAEEIKGKSGLKDADGGFTIQAQQSCTSAKNEVS